jgi:short-subunit dehydrogenase
MGKPGRVRFASGLLTGRFGFVRKNILITGASSGLGEEMARQFAAKGRNLALCARRTERLDTLRDELIGRYPGIEVSVKQLDVTDHDAVFEVFPAFAAEFGTLDRIIVNAGIGKGQPIGTGGFKANLETTQTNFVAALAQVEAAMGIFRAQNAGHLVVVSSFAALRGLPGETATYGATKAALSSLAEGIRIEMARSPIEVTTIQPGFIQTEMTGDNKTLMIVSAAKGVRTMVHAIEREVAVANIPPWPWKPLGVIMKLLPWRLIGRMV